MTQQHLTTMTDIHEKQKLRNLRDYLSQCAKPNDPSSITAPAAQSILDSLISAFGTFSTLPTAGLGHNGEIMLIWREGSKSLEIEILPNQTIEFFGYDRDSEASWGQSLSAGQTIPGSLLDLIARHGMGISKCNIEKALEILKELEAQP